MQQTQENGLIPSLITFVRDNKYAVSVTSFFMILAYGYFITNWAISIDSEIYATSLSALLKTALSQTRLPLVGLLVNYHLLPFWNDFGSVCLIFLSSLILATAIYKNFTIDKSNSNTNFLIFLLTFNVSPLYTFYLRFTVYNLTVSTGILISSILFFLLTNALGKNRFLTIYEYLIGSILLTIAISCYEIFVIYYICLALFFTIIHSIKLDDLSFKSLFRIGAPYALVLLISLIFWICIRYIIAHVFIQSGYTDNFVLYGNLPLRNIFAILCNYFRAFIRYPFNFFFVLSGCAAFLLALGMIHRYQRRCTGILLPLLSLYLSPFLLVFAFGNGMPFRTMQPLILVMSLIWFLIITNISNNFSRKCVLIFIIICTLFNAQFINRIFYGDSLRFMYDKNFGNQIYAQVLNVTGNSIKTKPLVIIGKHSHHENALILKSNQDTIGFSFFEWPGNPPFNPEKSEKSSFDRIHYFMSWLGNDYIQPTYVQYKKALERSFNMESYPGKGSIFEYPDMIVLKLSSPHIWPYIEPLDINFEKLNKIDNSLVNSSIGTSLSNKQINSSGWAFFKTLDNENNSIFLKLDNGKNTYYLPTNFSTRAELVSNYKDAKNIINSGYYISLNETTFKPGIYNISLILMNRDSYSEIPDEKTIRIK